MTRRASTSPIVGIVGTFDVANFGDLLFPELAAFELERRLGPIEMRRYSHRSMSAPPWPYGVRPIDELVATVDELDLLVVGGGHLVRFDETVAPGYEAVAAGIPHPAGYWLSPTLVAAAAGVPVAWNAVGASTGTPAWARPLVACALEAVEYVSVRDGDSLHELAGIAPHHEVRLVPDSAFGIRPFLVSRTASPPRSLQEALAGRPYVIVQASRGLRSSAPAIEAALQLVSARGIAVVEVPISPVLGDRPGLLGGLSAGAITLDPWPDPVALATIIAGARAVIAHSLHGSIVALAHGVPVFRAAMTPGTKYGLLATFPHVSEIAEPDAFASALAGAEPSEPSTQVVERAAQLEAHWDRVAELAREGSATDRAQRLAAARRLLTMLPGAVAQGVDAAESHGREVAESARSERDAAVAERDAARQRADQARDERREVATRYSALAASLARTVDQAAELSTRIGELDVALARERAQSAADRQRSSQEIARDRTALAALRAEVRDLRPKAATLERLRRRLPVRLALAVLRRWRGIRGAVGLGRPPDARSDSEGRPSPVHATPVQEQAVANALLEAAPGSPRMDGPLVSIVVLNRDGIDHLRRLLPALERTAYRAFELLVVDNASGDGSVQLLELPTWRSLRMKVIRNTENRSFADANNQAVADASGELLLFLNNDVEPLGPGWLGRLVDTLETGSATAVAPRLVYPRRPALDNHGDVVHPDLTLQHRGIGFVPADGVPTGRNLGTGSDPLSQEAGRTVEVAAATAACLLVRRDAFRAVGGVTSGYVYGTEDVDLCLKLRAAGGTILYDGGAVLWHHEYGTQNAHGRDWKRRNRTRNRQVFVDRWAPQIFREVFRDRVLGAGRWSEQPLHVAVTLTRDDPEAGWGDYYTAHELGDALSALGWQVTYAERHRDRWYELDPSVDVVISLLDAFDIRRIPRDIVTIAWVRNWTDRWISQPWFEEYDIVLASSARSRDIIAAGSTRSPALMPLATNPDRFSPRDAVPDLRSDLLFVGNHWGVGRAIEEVLPAVAAGRTVAVYGRNWEDTALAPFDRGTLPYARLPDAYASARIVVDDTAGPTLPYGAVNARVFDAIAAGALVISDNEAGARELFGDELLVARDAAELEAHVRWVHAEPAAAAALQARLRQVVLESHTFAHRAAEVRDHLLTWVEAERYAILVGVPDWDQAPAWGDYHFARDVQRQLEQRGHPTRIHLLDEWPRSPSARADVALHLHGLSDHRPRPSQLNILWVISHPDRITPQVCDRYDLVFVASDSFVKELASRVRVPVIPLHQATDPERFTPDPTGPKHELLFVGNTRGVRRAIVDDLSSTVHDLAVYGKGWTADLIDPIHVRGEHVDNRVLNRYYSSASVVLNDHWPDMRAHGFFSNRLYDALASGAFVVSDHVLGVQDEFDDGVVTYGDRDELRRIIDEYLPDAIARGEVAARGRAAVLARHTFGHRVDTILAEVDALDLLGPTGVNGWANIAAWLARRQNRSKEQPGSRAQNGASPAVVDGTEHREDPAGRRDVAESLGRGS
jgi:GT2 family glycosyltransferase/spore maturation protein CgeB